MEILFCDICNESVPQVDLDEKRAIVRNGRVVCANCDAAMSRGALPAPLGERRPIGSPPPPLPPPPVYQTQGSGSAVGVMALLLATLGIVLLSVAVVLGMDRMTSLGEQRSEDVAALRGEIHAAARSLESDVGAARQAASGQSQSLAARFDEIAGDLRASGERATSTALDLRKELAALSAEIDRVARASEQNAALDARLADQDAKLERIADDAALLARRLLELEQQGIGLASVQTHGGERPPEWMAAVSGLEDTDPGNRWFAVDSLRQTGDQAVVPFLIPMLKDPDLFVRMATARALGDLKSERAIGPLIDALEDQETSVREAAVVALRVTTGRNFKFDPLASETDRARKVKAWRDWYKKSGLQDEGAPSEGEEPAE